MPRALAIETSGRIGSVAVVDGESVVAEESFPHGLQHAAQIIPTIDRLLTARGWSPRDLEHLYVSVGPGSFTGLRIGVTLAKTVALATGVKVVAVPSVRVLVENAPLDARHVLIVLDAKRGQIFTARFERRGSEWTEVEPATLTTLTDMLSRSPRPVHLLGEGIPYHEKVLPPGATDIVVTPVECWRARALNVARLGLREAASGNFADPFTLAPIYIRKPEAEEKWDAAQQDVSRR